MADAAEWRGGPFDAVLLDAPCSSTGTIRRHPDIPWLKSETDLAKLAALQARLLDRAVTLVKPGGTLVYCTCSLEPEEGEDAGRGSAGARHGAGPAADRCRRGRRNLREVVTADGDLRTLPCHLPDADPRWAGSTASTPPGSHAISGFGRSGPGWPALLASLYVARGRGGADGARHGEEASAFMSGVSIAERARLSLLLGRRWMRSHSAGRCAAIR